MIISGGSRAKWRFFSKHLTNAKDNERVRVCEIRGVSADSLPEALREMHAVASGTRCENFLYHADLNPREHERLSEQEWEQAVDILEKHLGFQGQPRVVVEHEKHGRVHRHVVWSRIDTDTMRALPDSFTYRKHDQAAREIEARLGLEPVSSVLVKDRATPRPERRPKSWETFRGAKSGIDPQAVKAEVTTLWRGTDSGKTFAVALAEHGYVLRRGDRRDFCIVDANGNEHSLARRLKGVKAAELRARMADIDRDSLPSVTEGRAERRADKQKVAQAVQAGANRRKIEATLNASRAAEVIAMEEQGTERKRREIHTDTFARRTAAIEKERTSGAPRRQWQDQETVRRQRDRERELER